ncbi:YCF48-related protein [Colwellia sp. BRX9-1]|uniref:WD40/YVTN/BNR-like repeat-containing protein n=1 Tax=Colwellia sp. BRX9-1 TaxID=2759830 RepID=UPI0015F521D9|nr:YCF48-related protein [Colwellia sp. BRX9-1]MBA6351341.1 oxidoreductase [Colwellia sp. BRX9-1]
MLSILSILPEVKVSTRLIRILKSLSITTVFYSVIASSTTIVDLPSWQHTVLPGSPSLRGSAVIDNSLWVSGSNKTVFVSQDGGKTWLDKSVDSPIKTGFRDIALFDKHTAIVMGVGSGEQSVLYKTIDGGDSWQLLYQNEDKDGFFDSIAFWDGDNGLLMGDPVDGFYVIKKTSDGGKTWRRIEQSNIPKFVEKEAAFAASGNTLIVGDKGKAWLTTGGFSASVYSSVDFGETWQRDRVPLYSKTQTAGGYGLALNAKQQLFVVGGDYEQRPASYPNMATFTDNQWQSVNAGQYGLRSAMSCQGDICLATGKTSSDISLNAGKTWQVLANPQGKKDDKGFYTLASDKMMFLAAGAEGKVGVYSFRQK